MNTYTVVDNIYLGEGFYFVITNLQIENAWKYRLHGEYYSNVDAIAAAARLNKLREDNLR